MQHCTLEKTIVGTQQILSPTNVSKLFLHFTSHHTAESMGGGGDLISVLEDRLSCVSLLPVLN